MDTDTEVDMNVALELVRANDTDGLHSWFRRHSETMGREKRNEFFFKHGAPIILEAVKHDKTEVIGTLHYIGILDNYNAADSDGNTCVHLACMKRTTTLEYLLQCGGFPVSKTNNAGQTPVMIALEKGFLCHLRDIYSYFPDLELPQVSVGDDSKCAKFVCQLGSSREWKKRSNEDRVVWFKEHLVGKTILEAESLLGLGCPEIGVSLCISDECSDTLSTSGCNSDELVVEVHDHLITKIHGFCC